VFGGCLKGISGEGATQNAWEWDPVADSWRALANIPVKRCSAIAEEVNGKIYLIGGLEPMENGRGTRVTGLNQMYDPVADSWTNRSPMPTTRNHAFSGVVNGKIYVLGGRQGLDVCDPDHGPEVPALAEDEPGPSEPVLGQKGREHEEGDIGGQDCAEDRDGQDREVRGVDDHDHDEPGQDEPDEKAADHQRSAVGERESLRRHPPRNTAIGG